MQETSNKSLIQSPVHYDWSEFTRKERGFLGAWCKDHKYMNGEEFSYKTVYMLIHGHYVGEAGPKIKEIIRAALAEGLIHEETNMDQAA